MKKYYEILVFYFDKYDIYGENKVYMTDNSEKVIVEKLLNGYREIVTNNFIPEKNIIDICRGKKYDAKLGIYYTKKGITKEIENKGYILGTDVKYFVPKKINNLNTIKDYLKDYSINKFPCMLQKIENIKYNMKNNKIITNNLVTERNVKTLIKEYKTKGE